MFFFGRRTTADVGLRELDGEGDGASEALISQVGEWLRERRGVSDAGSPWDRRHINSSLSIDRRLFAFDSRSYFRNNCWYFSVSCLYADTFTTKTLHLSVSPNTVHNFGQILSFAGSLPTSSTNDGQIWCAGVYLWSILICQISFQSVYSIIRGSKNANFTLFSFSVFCDVANLHCTEEVVHSYEPSSIQWCQNHLFGN